MNTPNKQSVAIHEPGSAQVVVGADAYLEMIERAARDPAVDIDKVERLMVMRERLMDRQAKGAYAAALAEMQPKLPVIERRGRIVVPAKDGKTGHSTPYALWEDVNEAIRPHLADHGFALSFRVRKEADRIEVTGVLSHREGHSEETMLSLPMDSTGSKNNVQAIGSSVSYGKRYTAFALLNITSRGEDDDGAAAGDAATITNEQREKLQDLIIETGSDPRKFCAHMKVPALEDMPASKFAAAVAALESKRGRANG